MVSLISGMSDSAASNQFSILAGAMPPPTAAKRHSQRLMMSNGGSEDGFGLGRRGVGARRSGRLLGPHANGNDVNGEGGEDYYCGLNHVRQIDTDNTQFSQNESSFVFSSGVSRDISSLDDLRRWLAPSGEKCSRYYNQTFSLSLVGNYRQLYWTLKPLFFEVPTPEPSATFVGRQWLYREISEHLGSDLPTNRGVIITGGPATGKTAAVLQLVEHSCFGRGGGGPADPSKFFADADSLYGQSQLSLSLQHQAAFHHSQQYGGAGGPVNSMRVLAGQIVAYHFCQADNSPTCLVPEFVHSLAAQMSQAPQLTPYYQLVNSDSAIQSLLSLPGKCS